MEIQKQLLTVAAALKKSIEDCQNVYPHCQYVIPDFEAKKGGNVVSALQLVPVAQLERAAAF